MNLSLKTIINKYFSKNEWPFDSKRNVSIPNLEAELNELLTIYRRNVWWIDGKIEYKSVDSERGINSTACSIVIYCRDKKMKWNEFY